MKQKIYKFSKIWIGVLVMMLFCSISMPNQVSAATSINLKATRKETSCVLKWSKKKGAEGYKIYQYDSNGKLLKTVKTKKTTYTVKKLKSNKTYQFKVKAYKKVKSKLKYLSTSNKVKVKKIKISSSKTKKTTTVQKGNTSKKKTTTVQKGNTSKEKTTTAKKTNTSKKKTTTKSKTTKTSQSKSTLKKLLQTALKPVGSTMYVWGGGWNKADTGAGESARTIGVSPKWKKFFKKQDSSYNYNTTKYQIENGLDCSGYIGWSIYNILNTKSGKAGYVVKASTMASNFASRGWGTYTYKTGVKDYRAGDIMSMPGHVWMVLGQCKDGSVVLLHSSPPGVQIAGTATKSGKKNSQAVALAKKYMKKYYPEWYKKYPDCSKGSSYLTQSSRMRWDLSGKSIMSDPDGYRNMSAEQILKDLF